MSIIGWYYLHENGDLIFKRELGGTASDIRESDFATCMWPMDPGNRMGAWNIVVEGLALGARPDRVNELASKWGLTDEDAHVYASRLNVGLDMDGNAWCARQPHFINLEESHAGFGATALEALADLAKRVGIAGGKMWRQTFPERLSVISPEAQA